MALRSLEREMSVYLLPSEIQCAMVPFYPTLLEGFLSFKQERTCGWDPWSFQPMNNGFLSCDLPCGLFYPSNPQSKSRCLQSLCIILLVHQGGSQISENGEKIKALTFLHLQNTIKPQKIQILKILTPPIPPRT